MNTQLKIKLKMKERKNKTETERKRKKKEEDDLQRRADGAPVVIGGVAGGRRWWLCEVEA